MFYSYKGQEPKLLPERIRLSSGLTRTDSKTFTPEEIEDAGYLPAQEKPYPGVFQKVTWTGLEWVIEEMSDDEKDVVKDQKWKQIREQRSSLIKDIEWRVARYQSEKRREVPTTDDIGVIDTYIQALRDITKQSDPFNITWPEIDINIDKQDPNNG